MNDEKAAFDKMVDQVLTYRPEAKGKKAERRQEAAAQKSVKPRKVKKRRP